MADPRRIYAADAYHPMAGVVFGDSASDGRGLFVAWEGPMPHVAVETAKKVFKGEDWPERRDIGVRARPTTVRTTAVFTTHAGAALAARGYKLLQGAYANCVDEFGNDGWTNVFVARVDIVRMKKHMTGGGLASGTTYHVEAAWTFDQ